MLDGRLSTCYCKWDHALNTKQNIFVCSYRDNVYPIIHHPTHKKVSTTQVTMVNSYMDVGMPDGFCFSLSSAQQHLFLGKAVNPASTLPPLRKKILLELIKCFIILSYKWRKSGNTVNLRRCECVVNCATYCLLLWDWLSGAVGRWAALAAVALCQLLDAVIICALCLSVGHMHIMKRQPFPIKIIPSSSAILFAKLHLWLAELRASFKADHKAGAMGWR